MKLKSLSFVSAAVLAAVAVTAGVAAAAGGKRMAAPASERTSCGFTVASNAAPAARCAAIRKQCGGKFFANACGDKLLSAM